MRVIEADVEDSALWALARAGDSTAFAALYRRHVHAVYNYCFRRTGSWSAAEDLTSVVFLETWRRRDRIELESTALLPFLLGTANNVYYKQLRTRLRYRRALARLPSVADQPDTADDTIDRVDAENRMRAVLRAVRQLSRAEQDAIALCLWQGLSYAEAALAMGIPVGTVRSRLARARAHLRATARRDTEPEPAATEPSPEETS